MSDLRQTANFARFLASIGWKIEKTKNDFVFVRRLPLTPFSIVKLQRSETIDLAALKKISQKYRSLITFVEPANNTQATALVKNGFKLSKSPYLPTKTLRIDLRLSLKEILQQMKKDARLAIKKNFINPPKIKKYETKKDLAIFQKSWKKISGFKHWTPSLNHLLKLKKAFGSQSWFWGIEQPPKAGTVILTDGLTAYYYYAFTSKEGRKRLYQYLLLWQAFKIAKKRGLKYFDFEGIYDHRFPQKSWLGFSHFKKGFGGQELEYPGCYSISRLHKLF